LRLKVKVAEEPVYRRPSLAQPQRIAENVTILQVGKQSTHRTHVRSNNVIGLFTQTRRL